MHWENAETTAEETRGSGHQDTSIRTPPIMQKVCVCVCFKDYPLGKQKKPSLNATCLCRAFMAVQMASPPKSMAKAASWSAKAASHATPIANVFNKHEAQIEQVCSKVFGVSICVHQMGAARWTSTLSGRGSALCKGENKTDGYRPATESVTRVSRPNVGVENCARQIQSPLHSSRGSRETMMEKQKVNDKESVTPHEPGRGSRNP